MTENDILIDVQGIEPQTAEVVRKRLHAIIQGLAKTHSLDLTRLLGVTVTDRIDAALAEFDDGGVENGRTLTMTNGDSVGVAVTPVCKRDGRAFCHIFFQANDVAALLKQNDPQSRYILTHELGHAHDLAQKSITIEHIVLYLPGDAAIHPVLWQIADIIWNEYAACRKSGAEHPRMIDTMYQMLDRALERLPSDVRLMVSERRRTHSAQLSFDIATESVADILKLSSYVIGHRAALGELLYPLPPEIERLLELDGFRSIFEEQAAILARMCESHGAWPDLSVYETLLALVLRAFAACGQEIYVEDGVPKVREIPAIVDRFRFVVP